MGLHKRHTHGRVFHGLEAREQLEMHGHETRRNTPVMRVPLDLKAQAHVARQERQAASVVYVTLPQTFVGPAMFSTIGLNPNAAPTRAANANGPFAPAAVATPSTVAGDSPDDFNDITAPHSSVVVGGNQVGGSSDNAPSVVAGAPLQATRAQTPQAFASITASPNAVFSPSAAFSATAGVGGITSGVVSSMITATPSRGGAGAHTSNAVTAGDSDLAHASTVGSANANASASPSSGASLSQSGSGLSGGARAGLAIAIILAIALAGGLMFFCWRRKKNVKAVEQDMHNEKHGSFADAGARQIEAGAKRGSAITEKVPASLRSSRTASTAPRLSLRPVTQFLPNLAENGRGTGNNLDVAAAGFSEKPKSAWERRPSPTEQNPFDDAQNHREKQAWSQSPPQANPFDEPEGKHSSDSQQMGAMSAAANTSPKSSWEGSQQKSVQMGNGAAPPTGVAGNMPPRGPNNVHRVQLDFKPSMDDELELRSGQLVRMLHEYDDGWALCIRMDRSQQGVTPRTCLSKLPVKPRPQGPPPNSRPGTAQGSRRPSNARQGPGGDMSGTMYPRPLTPTQASRSMSPMDNHSEPSMQPAGVVPQRKPVPGQAM